MELSKDQLKAAEEEVRRYLPRSQQVYGFLVLRNRLRSDPLQVLVDRWPDFSVVVCKPRYEQKNDHFKDTVVFANDEAILRKILRNSSVFEWTNVSDRSQPVLSQRLIVLKDSRLTMNVPCHKLAVCRMMILEDASKLPSLDCQGIKLSSLDESHEDLVNKTWKFGKNQGAVRMIHNMVANFPSCCVLDAEENPVSWILTYPSCAIGMLYTLPEHRGKGYAKVLISCMAKRLKDRGYPVFCFIEEENQVSYKLFKGMGFTEDPSHRETWFGFNDF